MFDAIQREAIIFGKQLLAFEHIGWHIEPVTTAEPLFEECSQ